MNARRLIVVLVAGAVVAGGGFAGYSWWRSEQQREQLAAALPPVPDLAAWASTLRQRVDACAARVRTERDGVAALGELSRLYHANGFYAEAAACYAALEQLQPDEPRWFHRHASILAGYGDTDAAEARWRRVVQLAPDYVPARLRLADVFLKRNQIDEAAAAYNAILKLEPGNPYAELGLARCDFEASRWDAARTRLERLVAQTNYRLGYDLIVTVYERLGDTAHAAAVRARDRASGAYRDPPDPWIDGLIEDCYDPFRLSLAAGFLASSGDNAGAIRRLEQAIAVSPGNHVLLFQLAGVHQAMKSYAKARELLDQCTRLAPDFPDGWIQLSELSLILGDRAAAERALAEGLRRCPESPGLHQLAAQRFEKAGRVDDAIAEYRRSAELRPNEAGAYVLLAQLFIRLNRTDEARAELMKALAAEPEHPGALGILAFDAIARGDESDAQRWLARVAQQPRVPADQRATILEAFRQKFGRSFE